MGVTVDAGGECVLFFVCVCVAFFMYTALSVIAGEGSNDRSANQEQSVLGEAGVYDLPPSCGCSPGSEGYSPSGPVVSRHLSLCTCRPRSKGVCS